MIFLKVNIHLLKRSGGLKSDLKWLLVENTCQKFIISKPSGNSISNPMHGKDIEWNQIVLPFRVLVVKYFNGGCY